MTLADAAFGDSEDFRPGVLALGLHYAIGVHLSTTMLLLNRQSRIQQRKPRLHFEEVSCIVGASKFMGLPNGTRRRRSH